MRGQLSQFRAGFGTTARTARGFNVAVGAASPGRAFNVGQGIRSLFSRISGSATQAISQVARQAPRVAGAATTAANAARSAGGGLLRGAGNLFRGVAGRIPKGGILGAALGGLFLADILGRKTDAAELEGLTPEEKRERRRQDERGKTRGVLGLLAGIGTGALAGGGIGAALGAAGANPFTVAIGGFLGSIVGGIIGEEAVNVLGDNIIDGVTGFAKNVGGFFSGLWNNVTGFFGGAFENVKGFFGNVVKWFTDLPENIGKSLSSAWSSISTTLSNLPVQFFSFLLGPIGTIAKPLFDALAGKDVNKKEETAETAQMSLGGRVNFNEKGTGEFGILPNGTTFITPTSMPQVLNSMAGRGRSGEVNNSIVINVNAPGANEFASQLSEQVLQKLEDMYNETQSTL